ncbi:hypothetical protein HRbin33_01687 [bacterium HR33]|nr:hypothetical protein HRbin33_01687 [bacterium HR33]
MVRTVWFGAVLALGAGLGCAPGARMEEPAPSVSLDEPLTQEEIAATQQGSLLEIIQRLRPAWLRTRGQPFLRNQGVVVYLDGFRIGGADALRTISSQEVSEVRYLDASEATVRYGTGHPAGAIEVKSKRGSS